LGAEKEVAGNSRLSERARTRYFFMMPFIRFLLSCTMDSKGSTFHSPLCHHLNLAPHKPFSTHVF
jgi:hypothetical protein